MTTWPKLSVFVGLVVTTAAATTSLSLSTTGWYSTGIFVDDIQNRRATVQLIVQLLSALLGAFQLYALSCFIRFKLNIRLRTTPTTLDRIKIFDALQSRNLDFSLPFSSVALLLAYLAALQVPAAIWTAALTPVITSVNVSTSVYGPIYGKASAPYWNLTCAPALNCGPLVTGNTSDWGVLTYIPWKSRTPLPFFWHLTC
jgi:hypothetical protein